MGATTFITTGTGKTAYEAFRGARQLALYDHGHGGYTGTIAEKHGFLKVAERMDTKAAIKLAEKMIDDGDRRIYDKWGPAGMIPLSDDKFLFFGWASI